MRRSPTMHYMVMFTIGCFLSGCLDDTGKGSDTTITNDDGYLVDSDASSLDSDTSIKDENCFLSDIPESIAMPLGETLHLTGDSYLYFLTAEHNCEITLKTSPVGAHATVIEKRLTPDIAGTWELQINDRVVMVSVNDDILDDSTFLNYNYSPTQPVVATDGNVLWVAHSQANRIHRIDVSERQAPVITDSIPVGSWPVSVAVWDKETPVILAVFAGRDSLGFIDSQRNIVTDAIYVGDEPAGIIVDNVNNIAYIALSGQNQVAKVDLLNKTVVATIDVARDTRTLAWDEERQMLFAGSLLSGNAHPRGRVQPEDIPLTEQKDVAIIDLNDFSLHGWVVGVGTLIRNLWYDSQTQKLWIAASDSHNKLTQVDANTRPHSHHLRTVDFSNYDKEQYEASGEVDLTFQESSSGPAASPHTMMSPVGDDSKVWVSLSASNEILIVDRSDFSESGRLILGNDPRGLVQTTDFIWSFAWLDSELSGWPITTANDDNRIVLALPGDPRPEDIQKGQRIFNDANFSAGGEFSCNNCHPDGLVDGLTWNLLLDGNVQTIPFRNIGGTSPFLWGGQLPTLFDFSREVLKLVGAQATGADMELLTRYMQSVTAPPNPNLHANGEFTADALQGMEHFNELGCSGCHSGDKFTNRSLAVSKTNRNLQTDVPSLIAVYDSAPYGRTGKWETLNDIVRYTAESYLDASVDEQTIVELVSYVSQLPGKGLYFTSSLPLDSSRFAPRDTRIEVVFSDNLAPDQLAHFSLVKVVSEGDSESEQEVAGNWVLKGRKAKFIPASELALLTSYRVKIHPGLISVFGAQTESELQIQFRTGDEADTDVSGQWNLDLFSPSFGVYAESKLAFLQAEGGQVTAASLQDDPQAKVDHLEGMVSGTDLVIFPFIVTTDFGPVKVDQDTVLTTQDTDGDGHADSASGVARLTVPEAYVDFVGAEFVDVHLDMTHL